MCVQNAVKYSFVLGESRLNYHAVVLLLVKKVVLLQDPLELPR